MKIDYTRLQDHLDYALKNESSILRLISILGAFSDLKFLFHNELNDIKDQFNALKGRIKEMADNPEELERAVRVKHQARDNVARAIASDDTKSHVEKVRAIREAIRCGAAWAERIIHEVAMEKEAKVGYDRLQKDAEIIGNPEKLKETINVLARVNQQA